MRTSLKIVALLAAAAVVGSNVPPAKASDEQGPIFKWVDANEDCRDSCDPLKFRCPCHIVG